MNIKKNIAKILMATGMFSTLGLFADGTPYAPNGNTYPASTTGVAAVQFQATMHVGAINSLVAINDMKWVDVYAGTVDSELVSTPVSIYSNIQDSGRPNGAGQIVKIFGREANDVDGSLFQLRANGSVGDIGSTIAFEIHTMKGIDLVSSPQGPIAPGGAIIDTTGALSASIAQQNDTLSQNIYGVILTGTIIQAGDYVCNLVCKNYLGS